MVRPELNIPRNGYILFAFLPIGREQKICVMVRFAKRRAGEGLVCIPEVRITMVNSVFPGEHYSQ